SVKTWETDIDLQCISVGQDLLASLDEMTLSRLWGHEEAEHSPSLRGTSPQPLWFGEEDAIELDTEVPRDAKKEPGKEHSPKPGELFKELQTTVHHAKAK
ncbi:jg21305, partial [Pararge aegeria aegeria]